MKLEVKTMEDFDSSRMLVCRVMDGETNVTPVMFGRLNLVYNEYGKGWSEILESELKQIVDKL